MAVTQTYDQLRKANPYVGQSYNKSGWQKFLSWLGFRTQADAWEENMSVQAAEYDAALAQKQHDEQYESAQEQTARLEAAGLNPSLDPSMVSAGEAAPMGEDPSTPMQATGDEQQLLEVGNTIVSCFTSALGLVNGVQGIAKNAIQNRILGTESNEAMLRFAQSVFPHTLPDSPEFREYDDGSGESWKVDAFRMASMFTRGMNRKQKAQFNSYIGNFWNSAPDSAEAWDAWSKGIKNQKSYYGEKNEFYSTDSRVMESIYKHLGSAREQLAMLSMKKEGAQAGADIEKAEFDEATNSMLNPNKAASAQNAEFDARKNQAEVQNILKGTVDKILKDLQNDKSQFSEVFKFLLSCYSLYMFSK